MNQRKLTLPFIVMLVLTGLVGGTQEARAFNLRTVILSIYQSGFTAAVNLGHTVIASSNMNRLIAGGSFEARCPSPYTSPINGQRTLAAQSLLGGTQVTVTIPEWLPAKIDMPGFENVPGGTTMTCTYNWTASAEESTYSVGIPGISMTIGGLKGTDGGSVSFEMYQPGSDGEDNNNGCIHY